jgi:hypothetical protein
MVFGNKLTRATQNCKKLRIIKVLTELGADLSIPKYATHLVYMTNANRVDEIEEKVMYSIYKKRPKSRYLLVCTRKHTIGTL